MSKITLAVRVACRNGGGTRKAHVDRIQAEGYAARQIQNTLALVEPIKLEPGMVKHNANRCR